eukprot:TRINITY_DN12783_c0_g1_i2.p1 TRINITY_DN12783_c0_g1~~TRINITY_DN12783_c0_g1_i2.p1  ORF type:complete len:276 (-),score=40.51 TRINITY_DN12783_c0_g1_i2:74-901(-)
MARLGRGVGACSAAQGAGSPAASIGTDSGNAHDLQPERRGGYGIGTNGHANAEAEQADLHQRTGDSAITTAIDDGLHGSRSAVASCGKEDRGVDASLDDSNVDWSDIFGVATSAPLTSVEAAGTAEAACSSRSSSVGVGTDAAVPNVSVGVQAQLPSTAVAAGSSLSELETARVEGFLQSLRETNGQSGHVARSPSETDEAYHRRPGCKSDVSVLRLVLDICALARASARVMSGSVGMNLWPMRGLMSQSKCWCIVIGHFNILLSFHKVGRRNFD